MNNNENPCKIVSMSTSKTGKHGGAKVHMVGIDIFNGKKIEELCSSTDNMNVPDIERYDCQLIDIIEEDVGGGDREVRQCLLLDENAMERASLPLPDERDIDPEVGPKLLEAFKSGKSLLVSIMKAMGHEQIMGFKEMKE
jgi:translation initiation factor 5A